MKAQKSTGVKPLSKETFSERKPALFLELASLAFIRK